MGCIVPLRSLKPAPRNPPNTHREMVRGWRKKPCVSRHDSHVHGRLPASGSLKQETPSGSHRTNRRGRHRLLTPGSATTQTSRQERVRAARGGPLSRPGAPASTLYNPRLQNRLVGREWIRTEKRPRETTENQAPAGSENPGNRIRATVACEWFADDGETRTKEE